MLVLIDSFSIVALIVGWWIAVSSYSRLPETIPVHFGLRGEADGWGSRGMIFLLPVIQVGLGVLFLTVFLKGGRGPKPTPEAAKLPLHVLAFEVELLFTWLTWRISENGFGRARGLGIWFLPVVLLVIGATSTWLSMAGGGR